MRVGVYQETHLSFDPRRTRGLEEPGFVVGDVEVHEADILKIVLLCVLCTALNFT